MLNLCLLLSVYAIICLFLAPFLPKRLGVMASTSPELNSVPKVDIDPEGVFKYILLNVHPADGEVEGASITILRGYKRCNYHSDIYDEVWKFKKHLNEI